MPMGMVESLGRLLPELVLLGTGVGVLLFSLVAPRAHQGTAGTLALVGITVAAVAAAVDLGRVEALTFSGTYAVDGITLWAKVMIAVTTALTVLFSAEWFRRDPRHGEYHTILVFSALGAMLIAGAADSMGLVVAILLSSATGFVLAAYHRRSKASSEAAIKYYLLGALTNGAFLYGVALLFGVGGSTTYVEIRQGLVANDPGWVLGVSIALVLLGLSFKMGAAPAHQWVPDVAEGAPAPAAAFLTTTGKIAVLVALARLVVILPESAIAWRPLAALVAAFTMTIGNLAALGQDDVRRLLGWSSVSQTGYGLMAVVALDRSALAIPALLFFLLAYTFGNLAAFGVVVALRGRTARSDYAGLARSRPLLAAALVVSLLSFIGIPPLAGFTAKLLLFATTVEAGYGWLAVLAVANTVVSVAYYGRVLAPLFFGASDDERPATLGPFASMGALACGGAVVAIGLVAEPFVGWFLRATVLP